MKYYMKSESGIIRASGQNVFPRADSDDVNYIISRDVSEPTTAITQVSPNTSIIEAIKERFEAAVINDTTGEIVYYLDRTDPTKKADGTTANLDGTDGSVFIIKPGFWVKSWMEGNLNFYSFSLAPISGYRYSPRYAFGKYKGHRPSAGPHAGKLVSWSGVDITTSDDDRGRINEFREDARHGRNINWNITPYVMYRDLILFYKADIRNLNAQVELGFVSRADFMDWILYNYTRPVWQTGHMDDMPTFYSGNKAISVANFVGGTDPLNTEVVSYMGIEDFFGHIGEFLDGLQCNFIDDSPTRIAFICDDPEHFNLADSIDNYTEIGPLPTQGGYIQKTYLGEIIPLITNGEGSGPSTFYCDYNSALSGLEFWAGGFVGGSLSDGTDSGPFLFSLIFSQYARSGRVSSRLGLYLE